MKPRLRTVGWSVERPCVLHNWSLETSGGSGAAHSVGYQCDVCGSSRWCDPAFTFAPYDLEIHGAYYPGSPAYTPPGEYAPVDPPESPEFHIGRVCFAGTDVEFPWSLTEDEQRDIEGYVCEME